MHFDELVEVVGLHHAEVLLDELVVVDVGVADGDGRRVRPAHAGEVEDGPVVAAPERVRLLGDLVVLAEDPDGDLLGGHLTLLVAVAVRSGLTGHQLQLVRGETPAGRHRVGPAELLGEADADPGQSRELHAVDVDLARDGQVHLPEAQLALPREVRVGDEHAAAVGGALGADRPAVGRHDRLDPPHARRLLLALRGACSWTRGLRAHEPGDRTAGGLQRDGSRVGVDLDRLELAHPLLALAPVAQLVRTDFREVRVPAVGVRGDELDHLVGGLGPVLLGDLADADAGPGEVGLDVGVLLTRPEPPGPLGVDLEHLVGQVAGTVLAAGPALPERQAGQVVRGDVGDATLGAADGGLVAVALAEHGAGGPFFVVAATVVVGAGAGEERHADERGAERGSESTVVHLLPPLGAALATRCQTLVTARRSAPGWAPPPACATLSGEI